MHDQYLVESAFNPHLNCLNLVIFASQFASQRMLMMRAQRFTLSTATSSMETSEYFLIVTSPY